MLHAVFSVSNIPNIQVLIQYVMWESSYKAMYLGLFASLSAEFIHVIDEVWGYMDGGGMYIGQWLHIYIAVY